MERLLRIKIIPFTLLFLLLFSCKNPIEEGSMQPTEGYPFLNDTSEILGFLKGRGLDPNQFEKGEIVADIGAGNGYIEAMLSIFCDSITFYIQDIDAAVCNQRSIDSVMDFYEIVKGSPFTTKYYVVNGTNTDTNLPDSISDKILMLSTYQYLHEPREFILDIRRNLKDDGSFIVINPQTEEDEFAKSLREKYGWNAAPLEKEITDIISFGFELESISRHYEGYQDFVMVFKKRDWNEYENFPE